MKINIHELTLTDIFKLSRFIKERCKGLLCLEEVAIELMSIFNQAVVTESGKSAFVLCRFFKSCTYEELPEDIKTFIQYQEGRKEIPAQNRYLTLLGTTGDLDEWNNRKNSKGHQALPLYDAHLVSKTPMLSALLRQIGIADTDIGSRSDIMINKDGRKYGIFCVEEAKGDRLIPSQSEFVEPFGVSSVFGFGGGYKTDQIYAVIFFSREKISRETAMLFMSLNPAIKLTTLRHEMTGNTFIKEGKI